MIKVIEKINTIITLPRVVAPRRSFAWLNKTGSCMSGKGWSGVYHATECDEPQATLFTCISPKPWTGPGLRFTSVVPFPCCPWSLSPQP